MFDKELHEELTSYTCIRTVFRREVPSLKNKKYLNDYIDMFDVWVGKWGGIKLFIDIKQECCTCTCS